MNHTATKFRSLIKYMKRLVMDLADNRMKKYHSMTTDERIELDNEYKVKNAIYQRVRVLKVNGVTPNPIFL